LKSSEILQINATVIAGVLILLTITYSGGSASTLGKILSILAWIIIIPFATSSFLVLKVEQKRLEGNKINENNNSDLIPSIKMMTAGFAYLTVMIGGYVIALFLSK